MYELEETYTDEVDEPKETIHLVQFTDEQFKEHFGEPISTRKSLNIRYIIDLILCLVCALCLAPVILSDVSDGRWTKTVPLQILPAQMFTATVAINPTGQNIVPAMSAHGTITVYNGSFLVQQLPTGFILSTQGGVEVATDETVTVPAGNPPAYGTAKVQVHVLSAGSAGNLAPLAINETYGTSLYLKNLAAFSGGADQRTEIYATDSDKQAALSSARSRLNAQIMPRIAMLDHPCAESAQQDGLALAVSWLCQFVQYTVPAGLHVLSAERVDGGMKLEVSR